MESSPPALKVSVPLNWLMAQVAVDAECFVVTVDEELTSGDKLYVGDKITAIGDEEVLDRAQLRGALASAPNPGGNVTVTVQRTAQPPVDLAVLSTNNAPWSGVFNTHEQHHHMEASGHGGVAGGHRSSLFEIHPTEMSYRRVDDSLRPKLNESVDRLKPDRCILILCDAEFNPADEIKMLADQRKCKPPVYVNAGVKVRLLLNDATFTKAFKAAMLAGSWFVLLRATKAMRLLTLLASLVDEVRARNLEGVHPDARVIVACEPHPHFPDSLTIGAKTLRIRTLPMASTSMMLESISNSSSCRRIVQGGSVTQKALQRRVQLSNALEVVEIEAREVIMAESTLIPSQPIVFHEGSSLLQQHGTFKALPDDKFYGINFAGDANRLAVCSSLGNVYFVDQSGASLVSFHAHDSAVWDLSFSHEYDLVTGGEDGLAVFWSKQGSQDCDTLVCKEVLNFENDVYAVRHTNSKQVVAFGGFLPHVIVRGVTAESQVSSKIDLSTSVQSLFPIHDNHIVAAGADGKVLLLDCNVVKLASATQMHVKKCPCVTASDNTVMSGSFDGTVKIWDIRTAPNATPTSIKFSAAVTGIAADGHFMAACVGDGLHVWDLRNVKEPLGSRPGAWKGLSRGVVINAEHNFIGTASPDGVARFWSFEPSSS